MFSPDKRLTHLDVLLSVRFQTDIRVVFVLRLRKYTFKGHPLRYSHRNMCRSMYSVCLSFPMASAVVLSFQTGLRGDLGVGESRREKAWPNVISCHPDSATE